jgi:hypothetical protein
MCNFSLIDGVQIEFWFVLFMPCCKHGPGVIGDCCCWRLQWWEEERHCIMGSVIWDWRHKQKTKEKLHCWRGKLKRKAGDCAEAQYGHFTGYLRLFELVGASCAPVVFLGRSGQMGAAWSVTASITYHFCCWCLLLTHEFCCQWSWIATYLEIAIVLFAGHQFDILHPV